MFTLCVLLYGDHCDLAERCLKSISWRLNPHLVEEVRIGLNAVSDKTHEFARQWSEGLVVPSRLYVCRENAYKYPLLRVMVSDLATDWVMWFDDDSYLTGGADWFAQAEKQCVKGSIVGKPYRLSRKLYPEQQKWVERQRWYTGRRLDRKPAFVTGGWWMARSVLFQEYDWPPACAKHNGGDYMLGVLADQQKLRVVSWSQGVEVNQSARRGYSSHPLEHLGHTLCCEDRAPCRPEIQQWFVEDRRWRALASDG